MLANVGTGNVVLQDDDMNVPHKGIPLLFRRTYNSQSQHDIAGSDGTPPSLYGNGWTNTFDAHLAGDANSGTLSVFDTDGARYDYTGSDAAGWTPPAGQHATLAFDVSCGYYWTKKDGTTFYFFQTTEHLATCPLRTAQYGGYWGRIYQIIGRNRNVVLHFYYSWDAGDASAAGKIGTITVQTESGLTVTMNFVDVAGHRVLGGLRFPDGATYVAYGYDTQGNLNNVSRPANNAFGGRPSHSYGYVQQGSGGPILSWADSPRWAAGGPDGGITAFGFNGSSPATATLYGMARFGNVNPSISDGTNSGPLQPGHPTTLYEYYDEFFTTGVSTPTFRDTDGHIMNWVVDSFQRPTQTQVATSTSTSWGTTYTNYLLSNLIWDANDNLVAFVNPAGFETDAAYDAAGNVVALAEPTTSVINSNWSHSSYRPTRLFDYDRFSNLVAYCDPAQTNPTGNWSGQYSDGSDSYCTSLLGNTNHQRLVYTFPSSEPFGELTSIVAPSGYTRTVAYDTGAQGGADYGLATGISGTQVAQLDGTGRTPSKSVAYDANGNTVCARTDGAGAAATVMSYDALNRVVAVADPDDASMTSAACSKTPGLPGSTIVSSRTYFPDGSIASTQTPSEAARTSGTAYIYDLDGNQLQKAPYYPTPQSTLTPTLKRWFDGADRLVETASPADPNTTGDFPLLIRYIYDISMGGSPTTISGATVAAHGNLFEVEKNKPNGWLDFSYAAFDLDDRVTTSYAFAPCPAGTGTGPVYCAQTPFATQYAWDRAGGFDSNGNFAYGLPGLLAQVTNALGATKSWAYDADSRVTGVAYGDNVTPFVGFGYDADGRVNFSYTYPAGVANTSEYQYSADGQLAQTRDDYTSSTTSYSYYPDAMLAGVSAVTTSLVDQPMLYQYSYRTDGVLQRETFGASSQSVSYTYTHAGRPTAMTDFGSSPSITKGYDGHGQLTSLTTPAGAYGSITHDALGHILSYTAFNGETVTSQYDIRGDLIGRTFQPNPASPDTGNPSYPSFQYRNVQGVLVQSPTDQYDGLTGAPLIIGGYPITYDAIGRMAQSGAGNASTYTFDGENRLVAGGTTAVSNAGDANCAAGGIRTSSVATETTYAYNGRGELSQDTFSAGGRSYSRQWYMDRGSPLYTATGLGSTAKSLDAYQADGLGVIKANGGSPGLTISDLDFDGALALRHNNTGYSAWSATNAYHRECVSANPVPASAGFVDPFAASPTIPVDDGSSDGGITVLATGRVLLSGSMGYATPDYNSVTPYASASRGASSGRRPLGFQDGRPTTEDSKCASGFAWVNPDDTHECIPKIGHTGTGGKPGGGGGDGRPLVQPPTHKAPPKKNPCASQFASVGGSFGFLLGAQFSLTMNQNQLYVNYGPYFGAVPGAGFSLTEGVVLPNAGSTVNDVLSGYSVTGEAGFILGANGSFNSSGSTLGGGFMTPSFASGFVWITGPITLPFNICNF